MSDWGDGYVVDLPYTHGFYREQAPESLAFALLLKGIRAPALDQPFRYLELGCGQGVTANLLAAANGNAEFWAVDFNPSHIAGAVYEAQLGQVTNVKFVEKSFQDFLGQDTPEFDFITLHGIYSWISAESQRAIVNIIASKLRSGGVVYVSYNSLPGWAAAAPLQQLFIEYQGGGSDLAERRLERGLEFAGKLAEAKAAYFTHNPTIAPRLERLKGMSRSYLIHEYLNRHWRPLYFSEIVEHLTAAKLTFGASASISDHIDGVALSPEAQKLISEVSEPIRREVTRDYLINQQFRRDVFVKGPTTMSAQQRVQALANQRFAMMQPRDEVKLEVTFPVGKCQLRPEVYQPIIERLVEKPCSLAELTDALSVRGLNSAAILQALSVLVATGSASPAVTAAQEAQRRAAAQRYNTTVLDRCLDLVEPFYMASPVLGSAVPISRLDAMFLLAQRAGVAPVDYVWRIFKPRGFRFNIEGKALETEEENVAELAKRAAAFNSGRFTVLRALGVA